MTQMPTSSTSPAAMAAQITAILDKPIVIPAYGCASANDASCTCKQKTPTTKTIKIMNFTQTVVAGGVTYYLILDSTIAASEQTDTGGASTGCPTGGFTYGLRNSMCGTIGIEPPTRMPHDTMTFGDAGVSTGVATNGRHARSLASGVGVSVCSATVNGVCVTANPTSSPAVTTPMPTMHGYGKDDDFPGWAIALCVVLPVLAIGAGVAVYFLVCGSQQSADENAPDQEMDATKDAQA